MAKQDLVTNIPSDTEARKRLAAVVQEAVKLQLEIKDKKDQLKDIFTTEKEDRNISPAFLKTLVDGEFDVQYAAQKKRAALEDKMEQLEELEILMGRSSQDQ